MFLVILLLLSPSLAFSQNAGDDHRLTKNVKIEGWDVPDTTDYEKQGQSVILNTNVQVFKTDFHLPEAKPHIKIGENRYCEFRRLSSYSFEADRIFSISGDCVIFVYENSVRQYMGAMTSYIFLDNDGDGKFETRFNHSGDKETPIKVIRDWLEKRKNPYPWNLPDIDLLEPVFEKEGRIDGIYVLTTTFKIPSPKPQIQITPGRDCEVTELVSHSVEGKIFSLWRSCVLFGIDSRLGKVYVGATVIDTFIDEDDDGVFDIRVHTGDIVIPEFLRKKYGPPPPPIKPNH